MTFQERVTEFVSKFKVLNFDDAKIEYYRLVKMYHPDMNPTIDSEIIKALTNAWDTVKNLLAEEHQNANGKKEGYSTWAVSFFESLMETAVELSKISPDLIVTITGGWIWIEGETKEYKDKIKKVSLKIKNKHGEDYQYFPKFSPKKEAWYIAGLKSSGKGSMSLEDIKNTYGAHKVTYNEQGMAR